MHAARRDLCCWLVEFVPTTKLASLRCDWLLLYLVESVPRRAVVCVENGLVPKVHCPVYLYICACAVVVCVVHTANAQ